MDSTPLLIAFLKDVGNFFFFFLNRSFIETAPSAKGHGMILRPEKAISFGKCQGNTQRVRNLEELTDKMEMVYTRAGNVRTLEGEVHCL